MSLNSIAELIANKQEVIKIQKRLDEVVLLLTSRQQTQFNEKWAKEDSND